MAQGFDLRDHHRGLGTTGGGRSFSGARRRHDSRLVQEASWCRDRQPRSLRFVLPRAQEGAPQAGQIADRFHIVQNLREAIQAKLGRAPGFCARPLLPADGEEVASVRDKHGGTEHRRLSRIANQRSRQAVFDHVRALRKEGRNVSDIVRQTGFDRRTAAKWIRANALPERSASACRVIAGDD